MTEAVIRRAGPADVRTLAALGARTFVETFGHLYPPEDLATFLEDAHGLDRTAACLADPECAAWLMEAEGMAIGHALAGRCALPHPEVTAGCGELKRLYLLADWRGGGRGGRLLRLALDWLDAERPGDTWIGVWSENHGAQRLYRRMGFETVGAYKFKVGNTLDHEFIMRRRRPRA